VNALFVRVDNIGDLILTLPAEKAWLRSFAGSQVKWVISEKVQFIGKQIDPSGRRFISVSAQPGTFSEKIRRSDELAELLRGLNIDVAVVFFAPWWVARAIKKAGIEKRIGVASKPWAWFYYNHPVRQKRSRAERHEAQYNLQLIQVALQLLGKPKEKLTFSGQETHVEVSEEQRSRADNILSLYGVQGEFYVIHPGMAGSARNWPSLYYGQLAKRLLEKGFQVVITGTPSDQEIVDETGLEKIPGVVSLVGKTPADLIFAVLERAKAVIAPSTGVAHMAAAVGTQVVGIYSPVRVQAPRRWAPLGPRVQVLAPVVQCPGQLRCLGKSCQFFDCMQQITVDQVVNTLEGASSDSQR